MLVQFEFAFKLTIIIIYYYWFENILMFLYVTQNKTGKTNYQSPEVTTKKKIFDAKANDIWCVGVCLFKMILGSEPWVTSKKGDQCFDLIINGKLTELLKAWNKYELINVDLLELFNGFFRYENDRITIEEIKKNKWYKRTIA